jgi:hypothetical protein
VKKYPKLLCRTSRNAWYVQLAGKQVTFGPYGGAQFRRYHELMGRPKPDPQPVSVDDVVGVLDACPEWCQNHKAGYTEESPEPLLLNEAGDRPTSPRTRVRWRRNGRTWARATFAAA